MDEVVVTGERTGPGMWHAHHGAAQLWILGSLSPLPKGITWKANEVERVLDSTNRVLVPKPLEIGIVRILWLLITERKLLMVQGGKRLKDVLPPNLYARFAQLRSKYTDDPDKWERYGPSLRRHSCSRPHFIGWVCRRGWTWEPRCARSPKNIMYRWTK